MWHKQASSKQIYIYCMMHAEPMPKVPQYIPSPSSHRAPQSAHSNSQFECDAHTILVLLHFLHLIPDPFYTKPYTQNTQADKALYIFLHALPVKEDVYA